MIPVILNEVCGTLTFPANETAPEKVKPDVILPDVPPIEKVATPVDGTNVTRTPSPLVAPEMLN